jgi:undecaprenyl-diphosphatase
VQGLTEFLPVSSSGHLVLANYHLGWGESLPLYVDVATNTGTLLAVLVALRRDVWTAVAGAARGLVSAEARRSEGWRLALLVIVGSVPTALIGLGLRPIFEMLNAPVPVSFALAATGVVLWLAPKGGGKTSARKLGFVDALIAGVAQGLAVIPGVSRSGSTITALLWRGADGATAARLSFLMYLLVSTGVAFLEADALLGAAIEPGPLAAMIATSFASGYLAILWLFRILRRGQFRWFAPYLWLVAAGTLARVALT